MRSTFFEKNIEYKIDVDGENWNQGGILNGNLFIRNLGNKAVSVKSITLILAYGLRKAIKEKGEFEWEVHRNLILSKNISLSDNNPKSFKWNIKLDTRLIKREIYIQSQTILSITEREKNMSMVFEIQ